MTSIGAGAFSSCWNLKSVVIPEGITSIGNSTFSDSGITSVIIPEGVTSIGNYVFSGCDLTSIELPESLRSLGEGVFSYCYDLKSISIPAGVTRIESGAFNGYDGIIRVVSGMMKRDDYMMEDSYLLRCLVRLNMMI